MIYFRVDANKTIGAGHMMRCITIALMAEKLGEKTLFLISDDESATLLKRSNLSYCILNSQYNNLNIEKERKKISKIIDSNCKKNVLLIDTYFANKEYCEELTANTKVALIDNLHRDIYNVDLLINYTIFYNQYDFKPYESMKTRLLLGTKYVPLREQFNQSYNVSDSEFSILIMSGGSDPCGMIRQLMSKIQNNNSVNHYKYNVILGPHYCDTDFVEASKLWNNVCILSNVDNMSKLMQSNTLAVSAAGTTLYECCAVGLPTIYYCLSPDQKEDIEPWRKYCGMLYAGDAISNIDATTDNIIKYISFLIDSKEVRDEISSKMKTIVDGKGTYRIANELINLLER